MCISQTQDFVQINMVMVSWFHFLFQLKGVRLLCILQRPVHMFSIFQDDMYGADILITI